MKYCIFLVLILLSISNMLRAQDSKINFAFEYNIGASDRFYINDGSVPLLVEDYFSDLEKIKLGSEFGIMVQYSLSNRYTVQSGLRYIIWGYSSGKRELRPAVSSTTFPEFSTSIIENTYLELPLRLNYLLRMGSSNLIFSSGIALSYNVSNVNINVLHFENRREVSREDNILAGYEYRKFNLVGEFRIGLKNKLSDNLNLIISPNLRLQSHGIVKDAPLTRRLFFYGLMVGLEV